MEGIKSAFLRGVRLIPVLPSKNLKYCRPLGRSDETTLAVVPRLNEGWTVIDPQEDLPAGWDSHITPEGDSYWSNSERKIVTHADPRKPVVSSLIETAYEEVRSKVNDWNNVEVFFNASQEALETPSAGSLEYYCVNHPNKQVFWTEDVKFDKIGMSPVGSRAQLKSALAPEYWTHMDYFPCHRVVDKGAEEELLNILRHGAIDDMTAPGSTFPYSAKECRQYILIIEGFKTSSSSPAQFAYKTASIARLWASITRVRHINGYGLKNPRLDRLQGLEEYSSMQTSRSFKLGIAEILSFNMPLQLSARMVALWNGRIVYQRHWHTLFDELRRQWELAAMINIAMVIASLTLLVTSQSAVPILALAISVAGVGTILSLSLHRIHQRSGLATASDISTYISHAENYRHGLRGLSIVLSVPRTLSLWGILLLHASLMMELVTSHKSASRWNIVAAANAVPIMVFLPTLSFFRSHS